MAKKTAKKVVKKIDYFEEIRDYAKLFDIDSKERESLIWFSTIIRDMYGDTKIDEDMLLDEVMGQVSEDRKPGKVYMFRYNAKWKDRLPYWDAFPLVITLSYDRKYILGLNLHYLPPTYRNVLFQNILKYATNKRLDGRTRLKLTYRMLISMSKLRFFKPCIKKYLRTRIKKEVIIPPRYWNIAVNLPVENFKKSNIKRVWTDSINTIKLEQQKGPSTKKSSKSTKKSSKKSSSKKK